MVMNDRDRSEAKPPVIELVYFNGTRDQKCVTQSSTEIGSDVEY